MQEGCITACGCRMKKFHCSVAFINCQGNCSNLLIPEKKEIVKCEDYIKKYNFTYFF